MTTRAIYSILFVILAANFVDIQSKPVGASSIAFLNFSVASIPVELLKLPPPPAVPPTYAMTPRRRAFLNMLRYLSGTWLNGADSGYAVKQFYGNKEYLGAYLVEKSVYKLRLQILAKRGISHAPGKQMSPYIQDQAILLALSNLGILEQIDSGNTSLMRVDLLKEKMKKSNFLWTVLPVSPDASQNAIKFHSSNLSQLISMTSAVSVAPIKKDWISCRRDASTSLDFYAQIKPYQDGSGSVLIVYPDPLSRVGLQRVYANSVIFAPKGISFTYDLAGLSGQVEITLDRSTLRYRSKLWAKYGSRLISDKSAEKTGSCSFSDSPFSSQNNTNQI